MKLLATCAHRFALVAFLLSAWCAPLGHTADTTGTGAVASTSVKITFVRPSSADASVTGFDTPHRIYLRSDLASPRKSSAPAPRNELLLWLPGTSPASADAPAASETANTREGAEAFCRLAAQLGYHVISLRYPNSLSATAARTDADDEFERFRLAIIRGGASKYITVIRADSIEERLIRLLQHLAAERPQENWSQFLGDAAAIRWEKIAVAGQSQGGGHAALIALHHLVARVVCTGAPKDFNLRTNSPAAWLTRESATPKARFFTLNHQQDRQGANAQQQLQNLRALKLDAFGAPVNVDTTQPPYRRSRILETNFPGTRQESKEAHTSVISWRNAATFERVWRYMLTESVDRTAP